MFTFVVHVHSHTASLLPDVRLLTMTALPAARAAAGYMYKIARALAPRAATRACARLWHACSAPTSVPISWGGPGPSCIPVANLYSLRRFMMRPRRCPQTAEPRQRFDSQRGQRGSASPWPSSTWPAPPWATSRTPRQPQAAPAWRAGKARARSGRRNPRARGRVASHLDMFRPPCPVWHLTRLAADRAGPYSQLAAPHHISVWTVTDGV